MLSQYCGTPKCRGSPRYSNSGQPLRIELLSIMYRKIFAILNLQTIPIQMGKFKLPYGTENIAKNSSKAFFEFGSF